MLDAARARFAADGFAATTIRRIASDADVDPSQVIQFFGSKNDLFAAAMAIPEAVLARFRTPFEGPEEGLGERVVRAFLSAWEGPVAESEPLMAMLRGAINNEGARAQLRDFLQSRLLADSGDRLGPDAPLRAGIASSLLVGLIVGRDVIGVPLLVDADAERLVDIAAPAIQSVLAPTTPEESA